MRKDVRSAALAKRRKVESGGAPPTGLPSQQEIEASIVALDGELESVLVAAATLRSLLSRSDVDADGHPVAAAVAATIVAMGGVPRLARALSAPNVALQLEASWCLTNIAADPVEQVARAVLEAAPQLIAFAGGGGGGIGGNQQLREQSAWCIGNLAADSEASRARCSRRVRSRRSRALWRAAPRRCATA